MSIETAGVRFLLWQEQLRDPGAHGAAGFGDIAPVNPMAHSLATLQAIIGQLRPATLLARLVSLAALPMNVRFSQSVTEMDPAPSREIE